jgi:cobalt/nickel transport system permease protein
MGLPALAAYLVFSLHRRRPFRFRGSPQFFGALAGGAGILGSGLLLALALATTGESFYTVAYLALTAHVPILVIEGLVTCFAVSFLQKVKPEILENA